jgi:predicted permease
MWNDVRYALRGFGRSPGFAAVAIVTIALGIGANTAIFGLAQKLLFERLQVSRPDELVELDCIDRTDPRPGQCDASWPGFQIYTANAQALSGLFAYSAIADLNVTYKDNARLGSALLASGNMYDVLGVSPLYGRLLNKGDDEKAAAPVAVVGYRFWREYFGADPDVVGQTIRLNNHVVTIVGVSPAGFRGVTLGETPDITLPMGSMTDVILRAGSLENGTNWWVKIIGRRKPGITLEQVQSSLAPAFEQTLEHLVQSAGTQDGPRFRAIVSNYVFQVRPAATGGFSELRSDLDLPLRVLFGFVGLVLLAACANLAGLQVSRTASRSHEIAIRSSLGASRMRLARQFWIESLLLSSVGGLLGLPLADWSGPLLLKMASGEGAMRAVDLSIDPVTFLFTCLVIMLTTLLIGSGPVIGFFGGAAGTLRSGRGSPKRSRQTRFLVPVQVMLATILLIGTGLFLSTLDNLRQVELGYRSDRLATITLSPDQVGYDLTRRTAYWNQVKDRLTMLPGVKSVTISIDPIGTLNVTTLLDMPGFESTSPRERSAGQKRVTSRFVETSGMSLLHGRDFSPSDEGSGRSLAIVNSSLAKHFFKSTEVVGRQLPLSISGTARPFEIIGVVADARDRSPRNEPERVMYVLIPSSFLGTASVGILTDGAPAPILDSIVAAVRGIDPTVPIRRVRTMEDQLDEVLGRDRLLATLGTFFGGLALLIVAVGLYGLLSGNVLRRTREIGIRVALGAQRNSILRMILTEGLITTGIGLAAGLTAGMVLTGYLQTQLFGVEPNDPFTLAAVAVALCGVSLIAAILPARRASRIAPVITLSHE